MFVISLFVNIGMWFERFVITLGALHRDFLPSSWRYYVPTGFDWGITLASFGWFFIWFLLFVRFLPVIAMAEVKSVMGDSFHDPQPTPGPDKEIAAHGHA